MKENTLSIIPTYQKINVCREEKEYKDDWEYEIWDPYE